MTQPLVPYHTWPSLRDRALRPAVHGLGSTSTGFEHSLSLPAQVQKLATNVLPVVALVLVYLATQIAAKLKVRSEV